jgi:hypothetical protein
MENGFQGGFFSNLFLKFFRENKFCILFIIYFQTGFFHLNGFMDISLQDGFHLSYITDVSKPNLARRLRILPRLIRIPLASFNSAHLHNKSAQCSLNPMIKTMLLF